MSVIFLPLQVLLVALDLLVTLVTFKWVDAVKKLLAGEKIRSIPLDESKPWHRVHSSYNGKLMTTTSEGVETVYELAIRSFAKYPSRKCMGTRKFLGNVSPKVKKFGGVKWRTYADVARDSARFGAALKKYGVVSAPDKCTLDKISTPCAIAIFENTCAEWMLAAIGAFSQGVIVTTVYATLGMDAVVEAINNGVITTIVCNKTNVKVLVSRLNEMPTLKTLIYTNDLVAPDADIAIPEAPTGVTIRSFEDFLEEGDVKAYPATPPKSSSCAVIMYTSGSTGKPKGVVLSHANVLASIAALNFATDLAHGEKSYLGYLPLAHIMELCAEFALLSMGHNIGYADPKTLSSGGSQPIGALEEFKPTLMVGVPKIWDIIKKGVEAKVKKGSAVSRVLVETALKAKQFALAHGYDTPLFNALVFNKMSAAVGGNLQMALSGGGPLNPEVQDFIRAAFSFNLIQGYGLTETCSALSVQDYDDLRPNIAGYPVPCIEVKLETCEITDKGGLPYSVTDKVDNEGNLVYGRGEILCRGPNMALGYYMAPDKTAEAWEKDGWFHTGDIGQFMSDGSLRIVDRVKNLVKMKGGEYVAIEPMEMAYGNSTFVDPAAGGIVCYGDGDMDRPIALFQLNEHTVKEWAEENEIEGDLETIKKSPKLYDAILEDFRTEGKKAGLTNLEKVAAIAWVSEHWTPENGCLTAANKLQRKVVIEQNQALFDATRAKGIF